MSLTLDGTAGVTFPDASIQPKSGYGPAFSAYQSVAQSLTSALSKLQFQTKEFDTATAFDATTNYRFQPLVAGYYQLSGGFQISGTTANCLLILYKNGANFKQLQYNPASTTSPLISASCVVFLNGSTDYVELWGSSGTTLNTVASQTATWFQGIFIRGA